MPVIAGGAGPSPLTGIIALLAAGMLSALAPTVAGLVTDNPEDRAKAEAAAALLGQFVRASRTSSRVSQSPGLRAAAYAATAGSLTQVSTKLGQDQSGASAAGTAGATGPADAAGGGEVPGREALDALAPHCSH